MRHYPMTNTLMWAGPSHTQPITWFGENFIHTHKESIRNMNLTPEIITMLVGQMILAHITFIWLRTQTL